MTVTAHPLQDGMSAHIMAWQAHRPPAKKWA